MASSLSAVVDTITKYIEIKTEQLKLKLIRQFARVFSVAITLIFLLAICLFLLLFLSFALTQVLNQWLGSLYLGYLIVSCLYLLLIVLLIVAARSNSLQKLFEKIIIKLSDQNDEQIN